MAFQFDQIGLPQRQLLVVTEPNPMIPAGTDPTVKVLLDEVNDPVSQFKDQVTVGTHGDVTHVPKP